MAYNNKWKLHLFDNLTNRQDRKHVFPITHQYACRHVHTQRNKGTYRLTCMCSGTHTLSTIYKRSFFSSFFPFFSLYLLVLNPEKVYSKCMVALCFKDLLFTHNKILCMLIYIYIFLFWNDYMTEISKTVMKMSLSIRHFEHNHSLSEPSFLSGLPPRHTAGKHNTVHTQHTHTHTMNCVGVFQTITDDKITKTFTISATCTSIKC